MAFLQNELSGGVSTKRTVRWLFYKTNCPVAVSTKRTVSVPFLQNELSCGRFYKTNFPGGISTKRTSRVAFLQNELSRCRFYKTNCPGWHFYKTNCLGAGSTKRTVPVPFLQNELSRCRFYKTNCPVAVSTKRTVRLGGLASANPRRISYGLHRLKPAPPRSQLSASHGTHVTLRASV